MSDVVLFEEMQAAHGVRIGIATLNAEKTLNAVSLDMVDLLAPRFAQWAADDGVAMVILQAKGDKAFCAGGDLQQLYRSMLAHHASDQRDDITANPYAFQFFEREYRLNYQIHTYPKPILCWAHGIVMGGGVGLMAGASHRVVTERTRLAMPEISIGLYPDVGGSWFLNRMPGRTGLFMALTGASLNAMDTRFVDLSDYTIANNARSAVFDALCTQDWRSGDAHVLLRRILQNAEATSVASIAGIVQPERFAASALTQHLAEINAACGLPTLTEIVDALSAIASDDPWMRRSIAAMLAGAPGSLALAYALFQRTRRLSLAQAIRLEFIVCLQCCARHDFAEGIRSLLIDKDQTPHWQPALLADVTPESVERLFQDPWINRRHPLADLGAQSVAGLPVSIL
jgi:enoyl-CoA hydratase/carnithine racemase